MADGQIQDDLTGGSAASASFSMDTADVVQYPPLPELSWGALLQWMLRRRSRHSIAGRSMLPSLHPGDEVLYVPGAYQNAEPQPGDIVIAPHPLQPEMLIIKRVVAVEGDRCFLLGDNRGASTDSRRFGWVKPLPSWGKVVCRFS